MCGGRPAAPDSARRQGTPFSRERRIRYESKDDLLAQARSEYEALRAMVATVPTPRRSEAGVWGDDWSLGDLLAHLSAWHRLFLGWFQEGREGGDPALPAPGYRWRETPRLNRAIQEKHRGRAFDEVLGDFDASHREVMELLEGLPEAQLIEPGHFAWTGGNALVSYAGANTASHYRFAQKVLKRWMTRRRVP